MAAERSPADELVAVLLRETGEKLYFVLRYAADDWEPLYLGEAAERFLAETTTAEMDRLLEGFRHNGRANVRLAEVLDVGGVYCSLDLFGGVVLIHFFQPGDDGVIFGFDPAAAAHLTEFVSLILPYVREAGLDTLREQPAWERSGR